MTHSNWMPIQHPLGPVLGGLETSIMYLRMVNSSSVVKNAWHTLRFGFLIELGVDSSNWKAHSSSPSVKYYHVFRSILGYSAMFMLRCSQLMHS
jgi:hypothetical protein